jgi:predicted nucleic acid-binding protein
MLVVDAGSLFEVVAATPNAPTIRQRLADDDEQFAPHLLDVEVFSVIRRQHAAGGLDDTAAVQAVEDLRDWPGERIGHRLLLGRAWELRENVRGNDAMYVALAEVLGATLLTTDSRLARATGPTCAIEVMPAPT